MMEQNDDGSTDDEQRIAFGIAFGQTPTLTFLSGDACARFLGSGAL